MYSKTTLIGRLGKDPESRQLDTGKWVSRFSLATSVSWKDEKGEWQSKSEWHEVVKWSNSEAGVPNVKKGDLVLVEGRNSTRAYQDQAGAERRITEIVVQLVRKLNNTGNGSKEIVPMPSEPLPF